MSIAVALLGAVVAVQAADSQTQRVVRSLALLRLGSGAQEVELRQQVTGLQAHEQLGLLLGRPRRHLCLAMPRPRFIKGDAPGLSSLT